MKRNMMLHKKVTTKVDELFNNSKNLPFSPKNKYSRNSSNYGRTINEDIKAYFPSDNDLGRKYQNTTIQNTRKSRHSPIKRVFSPLEGR